MRIRLPFLLAPFLAMLVPGAAHAQWDAGRTYFFQAVTNDDPANVAAGEARLWAHVFPQANSPEYIEMYVRADRGEPPYEPLSITELVIHDGIDILADGFAVVIGHPFGSAADVDFDWIPDPTKPWLMTFRSNPQDPVHYGVGPEDDDPLIVMLRYYPGLNIAGITGLELLFAALDENPTTGGITVTAKVEGFEGGGTEYFELVSPIDTPPPFPTPEPSTGGPAAALAALAMLCRRWSRMAAQPQRLPSLRT